MADAVSKEQSTEQGNSFYGNFAKGFASVDMSAVPEGGAFTGQTGSESAASKIAPDELMFQFQYRNKMTPQERRAWDKNARPYLAQKLGTTEVAPMLISSVSPRMPYIAFKETPFVDVMRAQKIQTIPVTDQVHKVIERRPTQTYASRINAERYPLDSTEHNTKMTQKENALGFYGEAVIVPIVTQEQVRQQSQTGMPDLVQRELDDRARQIDQALNRDAWTGVQNNDYAPASSKVPSFGGLTNRLFSNIIDCGGLDISQALLEQGVNTLGQITTFRNNKVLFCDVNNTNPIWFIEIDKYGGSNPIAYMQWEASMLAANRVLGVRPDRVYESAQGGPIPVVHDKELVNTLVMMTLEYDYLAQLASFLIGGKEGPWVFALPVYGAVESRFMMDGKSFDDPGEENAVMFKNAT